MFTRSWKVKAKNKKMGVSRGFPDYLIAVEGRTPLVVEMKRKRGGRLSPEQKKWLELLSSAKCTTRVCKGFEEARRAVEEWLSSS